ncbi:MAG: hypothetical protein EXR77_09595 [Myxococcales bacterium]|nr:hypothetical protein [Myxococcales bacterium]
MARIFIVWLAVLASCVDNATYPEAQPYLPQAALRNGLGCVPNLDGQIEANELRPYVGVGARYRVATDRKVDQAGTVAANGVRVWDWGWSADAEQVLQVSAAVVVDQWYAAHFVQSPTGGPRFAVPFDADSTLDAVYSHDPQGLWLHGIASRDQAPKSGQTLLVYAKPVQTAAFPLKAGTAWQAVGKISNGKLKGLPYGGQDIYDFTADLGGKLLLPDITVDQALRVRAKVTATSMLGGSLTRVQTSFFFECLGEVARATAGQNVTDPDFSLATEVRRLAL